MNDYFKAGIKGALLVIAAMYGAEYMGYAGKPQYIDFYYFVAEPIGPIVDQIVAGFLFAMAGGLWALLFAFIKRPSVMVGMVYGLLPTLWLWMVVLPVTGGEFFGGFEQRALFMPLFYNCIIWGGYLGWRTNR